jgi:hypothetical protein
VGHRHADEVIACSVIDRARQIWREKIRVDHGCFIAVWITYSPDFEAPWRATAKQLHQQYDPSFFKFW